MSLRNLLIVVSIFFSHIIFSQNIADCIDAVAVCETTSVNYEVIGIGNVNDLPIGQSGCLGDGGNNTGIESNSIWFRFKAARDGELGFNIIPDNPSDDWDFAVYGPDVSCNNLGNPVDSSGPGDCGISNYEAENPNDGGQTGAGVPPSLLSGNWYSPFLEVNEGEEYLLLINSYNGGNDSFTLEWTGSLINDGLGNPLDCSIVVGDLGPDQDVCEGTTITLDGTSPSDNPSYKWFIDTGSGFTDIVGETNPMLTINNNQSGIYKVEVTDDIGNSDDDEVEINFYAQPTITPLPNPLYEVFDLDGTEDNYTTINLRDLFDEDFLNGQDPTVYIVNYYQSLEDAEANEDEIPNPRTYTNIHDNADLTDDIFARVVTIAAPNTCDPVVEPFKVLVKINQPPVLSADFRGAYCPLSDIKIAENFTITDSDDTGLDFFTIQISEGYSNPNDLLELTGTHPTVTARPFDIIEGKLILEPTAPATEIAYADLEAAVRDIIFTSTDPDISGERSFSFTIGDANYLPATEHFYVYEENIGITWSDAKNLADASTYFGLQGYLATILSEEESIISAEQISGTGWIGASDEGTEGEWKWVTGPEAGTTFWNGNASGSPAINPSTGLPYYSNWNSNPAEPNQSGNEDYAHITDNTVGVPGSWNDLPNAGGTGAVRA